MDTASPYPRFLGIDMEQDQDLGKKLREMLNSFSPVLSNWAKTSETYKMLESFRELWVGNR